MTEVDKQRILDAVHAERENIVAFAEKLIAIPTENPPGRHYAACVEAIAAELSKIGLEHEVVTVPCEELARSEVGEPRYAILARFGSGAPVLHFHGHYDVVPASNRGLFEPQIHNGLLYGRGSSDMKSGLAAMIYAVKVLEMCDVAINGSIGLTIVPDEETGGLRGSKYLADAGLLGKNGIGMLTAEPTSGAIWNASRGAISLRVTVKGKPIHVGLQHDGVNAFDLMVKVANALAELKAEVETRITEYNIQPEIARRSILMLGGRCEGGTNFNLVPGECSFTLDRRLNPEEDLLEERERIFEVLDRVRDDGIELDVEVLQEGESAGVSEDTSLARTLARNVEAVIGERPQFEMCPGLLEIRFYASLGIPAFAFGPGLLSVSHGPNEFVPVQNILDCTAIYALTACEALSS